MLTSDLVVPEDSENKPEWSEQDVSSLVQAVSEFKQDWYKISQKVGKDEQLCIHKFLSLPFTENMI